MIGKIVKGTSFSGCVNYVLKEDKSRLLKAVGVYGSPEEIAEQFELQTLLNDKVKNKVGHISLSFSAEDGDRIRDDDWRKRSIPTHLERHNPPTIIAKMGLKRA